MTKMAETREEIQQAQIKCLTAVVKLYMELCENMHAEDAFQGIFYGWAEIAKMVRDRQPNFYLMFNEQVIPKVLSIILSTNREATIEILREMMENESPNSQGN